MEERNEPTPRSRIASIDRARGLVILLMMMDHVRERFFMHTRTGDPIFETIDADLFFTRFATHLCAPIFIFLAGVSAWLYAHPTPNNYRDPTRFLLSRGLVVIAIEIFLYYLVWVDSYPTFLFLQVLWAIGLCMIALGLVCRLNRWALGALGLAIVLGHNLLSPIDFQPGELGYIPWTILHDANELGQVGPLTVSLSYPALPWFGVILLGYFAGPLFAATVKTAKRRTVLISLGVSCLAVLLVLRGFNIYGEALPWTARETAFGTVMAFLNYTKYPPSLDFLLVTLGTGLLLLAWFESLQRRNRWIDVLEVFGSVPMFTYVVHLYVLLAAYWLLYLAFGATHGDRFGLSDVWMLWVGAALLAVVMYPPAKTFARYKHREKRNKPWLSFF
ncbi:MAG: heparan-alpha-glucosaminide N-acetyltransferase domain-containing protein [Pseudomonadota bacterium]